MCPIFTDLVMQHKWKAVDNEAVNDLYLQEVVAINYTHHIIIVIHIIAVDVSSTTILWTPCV